VHSMMFPFPGLLLMSVTRIAMGPWQGSGGHLLVLVSILKNGLPELPTCLQRQKGHEICRCHAVWIGREIWLLYKSCICCLREVIRRLFSEM
jgi:hypothetical protein